MKRTLSYSLALVCALCAFSAPPAHAQIGTTCTITGTVYQVDGVTPAAGASLTVTRADKAGKLYANTSRVYKANSNGIVSFKVPRTVGTDTAVIHVKADFGNLASGQTLYVPSDSSATLESLVRYTANPTFVVVAVPTGGGSGDTSLNGHPRLTRIENVEGQFTAGTSDSLQQAQADAKLALNIGQGKAGADSVHTVLVTLSNLIAGKGGADSIHTALATLYDLVAGKPGADSVHTAIDAMLKKADTTELHAQKFAVINDSLFAISLRATSTANDLTAHVGTADAHLPSQTGNTGKFLQSNGTVSSWQTAITAEADPAYTAAAAGLAAKSDTANSVRIAHPTIPGLASADTNTVIGVDASGNLVLRKDDAGGGGTADSNRYIPIGGSNRRTTGILALGTDTLITARQGLQLTGTYTTPYDFLTIRNVSSSGVAQARIKFENDAMSPGGTTGGVIFYTSNGYGSAIYKNTFGFWNHLNGNIALATNDNERFRVTSTGRVAVGTTAPEALFHVAGTMRSNDTLRVGNYTTYSWIKPGDAAWTASSTIDVKRDISPTDTASATDTRGILARVASVDPVRYRFRPTVFRVPFDTSYANGTWFTLKLAQRKAMREEYRLMDSLRAEEKAAGYLTGFLAEQFNAAFGDPNSKEISYSDVVAVEWRAIQALIRRTRLQEQRIDALEETIRQMGARLKAGGL